MTDIVLARRLGTWSSSLTAGEIPAPVASAARRAILDTVAVMTAGLRHPATAQTIAAFGHEPGACRLVNGGTASAASAALINGTAAHAYDLDDTSYTGIMHGSAVILPVVLAAVEDAGADDATALAAFVAGSEIAYVLGDIVTHEHYFRGWWSTVTLGLIGATAAAARVYRLDVTPSTHAIALAASIAGGGKAVFGTDGKPFLVGVTARTAIDLAKGARAGLDGPENAFEDARGFVSLLNNGAAAYEHIDSLGKRWRMTDPGLLLKRY
ncbi:MAG: MmgE/PrpD family protein, partial [Hyphomicrobium sp.]|nr:MmgE/PrpD family protein [Hyphomicrobium sp.]